MCIHFIEFDMVQRNNDGVIHLVLQERFLYVKKKKMKY